MKKLINSFLLFTTIFTVVTLVSSIWQIFNGQETDTNGHILIRGLFTLIGVCIYGVFKYLNIKNQWLKLSIQYVTSILCIFLVIWGIGFIGELSKTAYRDAFFNWSLIFLSIVIVQLIFKSVSNKRISSRENRI